MLTRKGLTLTAIVLFCAGLVFAQIPGRNYGTGSVSLTGQASSIMATTLLTPAVNGLYLVQANIACESAVATATALVTIGYTDISNTAQTVATAAAACTTLGVASTLPIVTVINAKGGVAITYATTAANTPAYTLKILVTRLL